MRLKSWDLASTLGLVHIGGTWNLGLGIPCDPTLIEWGIGHARAYESFQGGLEANKLGNPQPTLFGILHALRPYQEFSHILKRWNVP